jgi:hypothetical protein
MTADDWLAVLRLLADQGFLIVSADKESGRVTVQVPNTRSGK